jgi:hypothetical protein
LLRATSNLPTVPSLLQTRCRFSLSHQLYPGHSQQCDNHHSKRPIPLLPIIPSNNVSTASSGKMRD